MEPPSILLRTATPRRRRMEIRASHSQSSSGSPNTITTRRARKCGYVIYRAIRRLCYALKKLSDEDREPMRVILQRVTRGSVTVDGRITGAVDVGFVALVGVTHGDTQAEADLLAKKTANLRVFEDDAGKMNLSAMDVGAGVLVVSQFTLYADMRKGRRP